MTRELGSGRVEFHADRPILHFGMPSADVERALEQARLSKLNFETTERMPQ